MQSCVGLQCTRCVVYAIVTHLSTKIIKQKFGQKRVNAIVDTGASTEVEGADTEGRDGGLTRPE